MGRVRLENDAKLTFEILMRTAFGYGYIPQFLYSDNEEESKIFIMRDSPQRLRKVPSIIISCTSSDFSIDELGPTAQRFENISDDPDSLPDEDRLVEFRGHAKLDIAFDIFAGSRQDRDMISDFAAICLRFLFRNKAAENGFEYTKILLGSDGFEFDDDVTYYTKTITVSCQSEFHETIPIELVDIINEIIVDVEVQY